MEDAKKLTQVLQMLRKFDLHEESQSYNLTYQ